MVIPHVRTEQPSKKGSFSGEERLLLRVFLFPNCRVGLEKVLKSVFEMKRWTIENALSHFRGSTLPSDIKTNNPVWSLIEKLQERLDKIKTDESSKK